MHSEGTLTRRRWWQRKRGDHHVERRVLTDIPGLATPTLSGVTVTPQTALRLIDVLACVRLLAETASTLPLKSYMRREDGGRDRFEGRVSSLIDSPAPATTTANLISHTVASLAFQGNAYVGKYVDPEGEIAQLGVLPADRVAVAIQNGRPVYKITDLQGRQTIHGPEDVLHLRMLSLDGVVGLSPVAQAREALGQAQAVQEYGASLWANSATPSGVLSVVDPEAAITDDVKQSLVQDFEARHKGPRQGGKIAVFDGDVKFSQVQLTPVDAQWIESRRLSTAEIARLFGVPPHLVGAPAETSSLHYSTAEQDSANFIRYSLARFLTVIEQGITADPTLCPPGVFCEFDLRGFLRSDAQTRATVYQRGLADGWLAVNEVRRAENLAPIPGGDLPRSVADAA